MYRLGFKYGTEKNFSGYEEYTEVNKTVTTNCGNAGKGKRYYTFSTWTGLNEGYGSLKGNVVMQSY